MIFWQITENSHENTYVRIFFMNFQALRPATLSKSDSSKDVFTWIWRSFKNTNLRTTASESVRYLEYILLSECRLEE